MSRGFKFYDPSTRSFFETSNAKFIEDVELSGRETLRKVVSEEESVSIPIIATGHGHIMFDDTIQNVQPITETINTLEIPPTQVEEPIQVHEETKRDSKGNSVRYKARIVAKGFTQKECIDYKETFSPVSSNDSFRIIMTLVTHYDLELHQIDVKTVFLNGNIDETIYMVQLENLEFNYSKQLVITSFGFKENTVDQCIYLKFSGSKFMILVLYVDDILLASSDIYRDRSRGILGLSQNSYIDKVLSRFGMSNCAPRDTPMAKGDKFSLHQCPRNELEMKDMERELKLTYRRSSHLEIVGYSNSDFAGCLDNRRYNSCYVFMLAGGAVSWKSVKQTPIASSTMEAEFIACYEASNHGIWLRNFITELRIVDGIEKPLRINCDNKVVELYSKNNRSSSKSKHINIKFLVVKKKV
ncbi:Retrovirus-related Pol polyprotein from transposon TNT 1-94 [Vitis vinifera]|uniref:Retrovirus-related Pol polyprotein from transposon TNT 1-94 n=1 Tax=Vitis vinifera TaxID=29760 RepID=A0A438ET79_VITVI|nr:Retrovirus-related Pol polyprotein from transposon TNT 1-94 [Vitis vinifera]